MCEITCFQAVFSEQGLAQALAASVGVWRSLIKSECLIQVHDVSMPLTELVTFQTRLQKGNRIQVPKLIRWRYKLETDQALKVTVHAVHLWGPWQTFYACMDGSGRITVPRLIRDMLADREDERKRLVGAVLEVRLQPA